MDDSTFVVVVVISVVVSLALLILCFCFGRRLCLRFCLGRPYYCCCCPCVELCGCCLDFKLPDDALAAQEKEEALQRKMRANTVLTQKKLLEAQRASEGSSAQPQSRGLLASMFATRAKRSTGRGRVDPGGARGGGGGGGYWFCAGSSPGPQGADGPFGVQFAADPSSSAGGLTTTLTISVFYKAEGDKEGGGAKDARDATDQAARKRVSFEAANVQLGGTFLEYTIARVNFCSASDEGPAVGAKEQLRLSHVTAVALINEPSAWTLFLSDGRTFELRADSAASRQKWIDAICERLQANEP